MLEMSAAKIVRCHNEHPDVETSVWHDLPGLLHEPLAIFPSSRRDGSLVIALVVTDSADRPVIVPVVPGSGGASNIVLSVFGKDNGWRWIDQQLKYAEQDGIKVFRNSSLAATMPQPEAETSSSPGPIPADGTARPSRKVLTIVSKVKADD